MDKREINAKVQMIFNSVPLSIYQKELINEVINDIIDSIESSITSKKSNNKTIASATETKIGGIRQLPKINHLEEDANIDDVIATINTLLFNLEAAGTVVNK